MSVWDSFEANAILCLMLPCALVDTSKPASPAGKSKTLLKPLVVPLSSLRRMSKLNLGYEPSKLAVHPENEAIFTASNNSVSFLFPPVECEFRAEGLNTYV